MSFLDRRDLHTHEVGIGDPVRSDTMNQCRIICDKARIILMEKIKASESLCWVWCEGIVQGYTELVLEAAAVDGNRHAAELVLLSMRYLSHRQKSADHLLDAEMHLVQHCNGP